MVGLFAAVGQRVADAGEGPTKIVGSSCAKAFELKYYSEQGVVLENHALDSAWVHLEVTRSDTGPNARHYEIRWSFAPGVKACASSATLGYGNGVTLSPEGGQRSADLRPTSPVRVFVRGEIPRAIRLRGGLGPSRVRALVIGWARRGCALRTTNAPAAELLADLAGRGHAHGCRGPGRSSTVAANKLLHHLSAYFNARPGGPLPAPGHTSESQMMAREYYRVLGQLTTGAPVPPAPHSAARYHG